MKIKKIISLLLSLFLIVSIIPSADVSASGYTLEQLKAKFPDGKYWNHQVKAGHGYNGFAHYGSNCGDIENTVTSHPCKTHEGTAGIGDYDCNTYRNNSMQCAGFARKLANLVYGVYDCKSSWKSITDKATAISQVKPGDVIWYFKDGETFPDPNTGIDWGHWVFVTAVAGSTVTLGECNYGGTPSCNCLIKWGRQLNLNNVSSLTLYKAPYAMPSHTHKYDKNTYMCSCGAFNPGSITTTSISQTMQITKDAIDHSGPYGDCKIVNEYKKGATVIATQKVINGFGSVWYKLSNGYYIYSDYVKNVSSSYPAISARTYYIKNVATGTWLSVSEGKDVNMNAVNLWTNTGDAMKMVISKAPTGYKIRPYVCKSRLVNPNAVYVSHNNDINIYDDVNDSSQWWQFEKVGKYYVIHNVQNPSCVLDAPNGKTSIAYARTYTGADSQKWILECVSHSYDKGSVTTNATCKKTGVKTYTCTVCGTTKNETLSKIDHIFDSGKVVSAATCNSDGRKIYTCTMCGMIKNETISKTNHKYVSTVIAPSCTNLGYTVHKCSICGDEYTSDEIPKMAHDYNETSKAATCTENGYYLYTCSFCGSSYDVSINKTGHSWDNGKITSKATCHSTGVYTYTCTVCGETRTETIEKIGHSYVSTVIAPTCYDKGYTKHTCSVCGDEYTSDEQRNLAHKYVETKKEKTCTEDGYIRIDCSLCKENHITIFYHTGHEWDNGKVTKTPTTTQTGIYTYTCTACGETKTDIMPVIPESQEPTTRVPDEIEECTTQIQEPDEPDTDTMPGDVDDDGQVTASDARLALRASVGLETLSSNKKVIADMDADGKLTASDARKILRIAVGLDKN